MESHRRVCDTVVIIDRDGDINTLNSVVTAVQQHKDGVNVPGGEPIRLVHRLCYTLARGVNKIAFKNIEETKTTCWLHIVSLLAVVLVAMLLKSESNGIVYRDTSSAEQRELSPLFPSVTLCNNNKLMKSASNEIIEAAINMIYYADMSDKFAGNGTDLPELDSIGWMCLYSMAQHHLSTMLVKCKFGGRPCGVEDFTPSMTDLGLCYTFNAGETFRSQAKHMDMCLASEKQPISNSSDGHMTANGKLELWLSAQQEEYSHFSGQLVAAGFSVNIEEPGTEHPLIAKTSKLVGPGINHLSGRKYIERNRVSTKCIHRCMKVRQLSACGCVWFYDWKDDNDASMCNPVTTSRCLIPATSRAQDDCTRECGVEREPKYEVTTTNGPLSMVTLKNMPDFWPYVNHGDTPSNKSTGWRLAMGLPLEPYFYWKENLVIVTLDVSRDLSTSAETNHHLVYYPAACYICYVCSMLSALVFCTGFSLLNCLKIGVVVARLLVNKLVRHN